MGALDQLKFSGLSPDQVDQLPPHLRHRCGVVFILCRERVSQLAGGLADGHGLAVRENILQTQQNVPTAVAQFPGVYGARRNGRSPSGYELDGFEWKSLASGGRDDATLNLACLAGVVVGCLVIAVESREGYLGSEGPAAPC